jgi:hypothetical protein
VAPAATTTPVNIESETVKAINDAIEAINKAATEMIKVKRKRPQVAPAVEQNIADELGEDAELQAAIAASLEK